MKKIATTTALLFALLLFLTSLKAQTVGPLYGLTEAGGDSSGGVLFKYNPANSQDSLVYQFSSYSPVYANYDYSNIIQGTDGNFYGITEIGGSEGIGALYKCTPAGKMTVLVNFTGANGQDPRGSLLQASDGNLYGMADQGGKYGDGVIFRCTTTGVMDTLLSFNGTNGADPTTNSLIQAKDGNLYGMTQGGGKIGDGVIFKYSITQGTYDTLLSFNSRDGYQPWGSLVQGTDGKLYGMTSGAGKHGDGVIFRCTTTGVLDTLASFNYYNGYINYGSLIEATDGNFYGMAYAGGADDEGVFFKYDTITRTIDSIVSFRGANGEYPVSSVIQATDGNIYGITEDGGAKNEGVIFKYNISLNQFDTLVSFTDGATGEYPISNLIQTSGGNLYGLTWEGGASTNGTLFQCTTSGALSVVYNIGSTYFGYDAVGSLIQGTDGYLYGTSNADYINNNGNGTLFKCLPSGADMTTLFVFNGSEGLNPDGKLLLASDGNLYGMAHNGGKYGEGVVYKYTLPNGPYDTLVSFNGTNGAYPWGNLIQGYDGNFYGVTSLGGSDEEGTVFKCTMSGVITVFHSFTGLGDGEIPRGSLIQGKDSVLYGLTEQGGGSSEGSLFKCTTSGVYTYLTGMSGEPYGSLVQGVDGNLYGLSSEGGNYSEGSLFIATTSGQVTNLVSFTTATGSDPQGTLIQASDSALYGMTTAGGKYDYGVVFKYNISPGTYDTLFSFNTTNGKLPQYGNLLEFMSASISVSSQSCSGYQLTAVVSGGGAGALKYSWLNNDTTQSISNITSAGTYTVTVKNSSGLTVTASVTVSAFTGPTLPTFTQYGNTLVSSSKYNNQWYRNDTLLTGDTSQDIIINALGWYWVDVNDKTDTCNLVSDSIDITTLTGINQPVVENGQVTAYPNPFGNNVVVKINSSVSEIDDWNLLVTDVLGRTVYFMPSLNYTNDIDLSNQPSGVYFITVLNKTGKIVLPVVKE